MVIVTYQFIASRGCTSIAVCQKKKNDKKTLGRNTYPAIIGKQFRMSMSPLCTLRVVAGWCAQSVLMPDVNHVQAENTKKYVMYVQNLLKPH